MNILFQTLETKLNAIDDINANSNVLTEICQAYFENLNNLMMKILSKQ
ncbi:hypothetical protein EMA8858_02322 [Emticicia aquatica]|uniref:Uncharacterized protein n=1 Tax=Emticicia aquatica TaxID=1681835 RepID=A0ABM9AR14_9BACT|nr:hypothetical protein [Emticicia aquatica]CAH0996192.1 hypothetical protein EMA8858_02322 [Emticicia aquatica]